MNTLLVFVALSCVIGVSSALSPRSRVLSRVAGFYRRTPPKGDCRWLQWTMVGRCEPTGPNTSRWERRREKIPAEDGGKECVGSEISYIPCEEIRHVASTFLKTVNTLSAGTNGSGGGERSFVGGRRNRTGVNPGLPSYNVTVKRCTKPYRDRLHLLRMIGRPCITSRRRRRGVAESTERREEPIAENITTETKKEILSHKRRDILFLLDESGSVGSSNFKKELRMARAVVNSWCGAISIERNQTRVGILSFDREQHHLLDFDELFEKSEVLKHMDDNIRYTSRSAGATCLNDALEYTRTSLFHMHKGGRINDSDVEQLVVLFTDGCANCENQQNLPTMLKNSAMKLEQQGISIVIYFIGDLEYCKENMENLADGSRCYQAFRALDWEEFDLMIAEVEAANCTTGWRVVEDDCPTT